MERRKQGRGWHQHFIGFWARLNCEEMPVIPAWIVRSNLDDPRKIPYLLIWRDDRGPRGSSCPRLQDGEIKEVVRLTCHGDPYLGSPHRYVELKRTDERQAQQKRLDGNTTILQIVWRMLPRNGGRALFLLCPCCDTPRRHVYGCGMVEQRQTNQLAMPLLCSATLFL